MGIYRLFGVFVGRLNRIVLCIPVQSLNLRRGVITYPIAQILTVDQPRGMFSGGGVHRTQRVWGRIVPTKCIRFTNPVHTR